MRKQIDALRAAVAVAKRIGAMELATGPRFRFRRPDLLACGFLSQRATLYPLDRFDRRWFLTDWEIEGRLGRINSWQAMAPVNDKLYFHLHLKARGLDGRAASLVGVLFDGRFSSLSPFEDLDAAFKTHERLIVKPAHGAGGRDVSILRAGDPVPAQGLYLVEEVARQHAYAAAIFPDAVNTIRVLTMTDVDDGAPFIAAAAHRFGVRASAPVDNFKKGGVSALVALDMGVLSEGRSNPGVHDGDRHARHPDTGAPIAGATIPMWAEVKALALELAGSFPGLHYAGWDMFVAPDGPRVIEGNGYIANPNLIQAHAPLLLDARVRRFLRAHGVLSDRRVGALDALAASASRIPTDGSRAAKAGKAQNAARARVDGTSRQA